MIQGFYSAATGAQQQMLRMGVHGNNIANVNNYGFKVQKPAFGDLMYGMVTGAEDAQLPKGSGTRMVATVTDFGESEITPTGRDQDYAILGEGFFALYNPATQEISFTRDGAFSVNSFQELNEAGEPELVWYLTDGEGRQVMNTEGYPIVVTDPTAEQPVGTFLIQYKDGLQHADSGRFVTTEKNGAVWVGTAKVQQGYLETSNTDLAYEMSKVIESQRAYVYALRMVSTADEVETTINNLTN